jgi:tRNA A37 threonylcarbamoyladenosine biosynthesis protein TsaE
MSMSAQKVRLFHLDLYRLETEEQIAVLGLDEMAGYPELRWCWWSGASGSRAW